MALSAPLLQSGLLPNGFDGPRTLRQIADMLSDQVRSSGRYGRSEDAIGLPAPFGFAVSTDEWPPYAEGE